MKMQFDRPVGAGALALALAAPGMGHADPAMSLKVAGRALRFLETGPSGKAARGLLSSLSEG